MPSIHIFLSAVSAEFQSYREALRRDLDRPNVTVKIQEDFIASGSATLAKLDDYIRQCDAVVHLVGDMTGAPAEAPSLAAIRERHPDLAQRLPPLQGVLAAGAEPLSYTQWEAWLALYHRKALLIAVPHDSAARDPRHEPSDAQRAAQQAHLARLGRVERFAEIRFTSADRLAVELLRSGLQEIVAGAGSVQRAIHLPHKSLGDQFLGRDTLLAQIDAGLGAMPHAATAAAGALVLSGLSGSGKTRAAIEFAWREAGRRSAVLFVPANSPQALRSNFAALCSASVLNLPEQRETEERLQFQAVLRWLRQHPGWLLILDNLDSEDDAQAAEALLPQLIGGQVLLTSTLSFWSSAVRVQPVGLLDDADVVALLLARTASRRRVRDDDLQAAEALAPELGGLPLALEQAAAYVNTRRLTLAQYLQEWKRRSDAVLAWLDPRLMGSEHSVATTWQAAFDQLSADARGLLARLAWFDASPIPESMLDEVQEAGTSAQGESQAALADAWGALSELEGQSLVTRADDQPQFSVHRLVQQVTRQRQAARGESRAVLDQALGWMAAAYAGELRDPLHWPRFEALVMHARTVAWAGADAGLDAADDLLLRTGAYQALRARHADAEVLMRRALDRLHDRLGPDAAEVGRVQRQLGALLDLLNRKAEARPLLERALAVAEVHKGPGAVDLALVLREMAWLLGTPHNDVAEPCLRRAISELERAEPVDDDVLADALRQLAMHRASRDMAEARSLAKRALQIRERQPDKNRLDLGFTVHTLAQTAVGEEQVTLAARAVAILEPLLGPQHPSLAWTLNLLALAHSGIGEHGPAEQLARRALAIDEAAFGPDHPAVAFRLRTLAEMVRQGLPAIDTRAGWPRRTVHPETVPWLRRRLAIVEANQPPAHAEVLLAQFELAETLADDAAQLAEAIALMRRAVDGSVTTLGPQHAMTGWRQRCLEKLSTTPGLLGSSWRCFEAPSTSLAADDDLWQALRRQVDDTLAVDVRALLQLCPDQQLRVNGLRADGAGSGLMALTISDDGVLFLSVWDDPGQTVRVDAGRRAALVHDHGMTDFDGGSLGRLLGPAAEADAAAVAALVVAVLRAAFDLPRAGLRVRWPVPAAAA